MPNPGVSLQFALIHNGSDERLCRIRPLLTELANRLDSEVREYHWQPGLEHPSFKLLDRFRANRFSERLHRQHLRFRGNRHLPATLKASLLELARGLRGNAGTQAFRSLTIEMLVTDKHVRAWTNFLDSTADALIVLEDDAVIREDTELRLRSVLADDRVDPGGLLYLDLAGGFPLRKLCPPEAVFPLGRDLLRTAVPLGNTACGYALSRSLAGRMVAELTWRPELRRVGIDWLVNELLMRIHLRTPVDCLHTDPPILGHGSFLGTYRSQIQPRFSSIA